MAVVAEAEAWPSSLWVGFFSFCGGQLKCHGTNTTKKASIYSHGGDGGGNKSERNGKFFHNFVTHNIGYFDGHKEGGDTLLIDATLPI